MAFRLLVEDLEGNLLHERVLRDGQLTIGRSPTCDLPLVSTSVSREHARFFVHLGRAYVEDLRSSNGVVVNGVRIRGVTPLTGQAIVVVGDHLIRFGPAAGDLPEVSSGSGLALVRLDEVTTGPRVLPVSQASVRLGRGSAADLQVGHHSISRLHAEIRTSPDGLIVRDLGSANGTTVNGTRISRPVLVKDGDYLQFGDIPLLVSASPTTVDWRSVRAPTSAAGSAVESASGPSRAAWVIALVLGLVLVAGAAALFVIPLDGRGADPLDVAAEAINAGDWSAAIRAYETALEETPASQPLLEGLARARAELDAEQGLDACESRLQAAQRRVATADNASSIDAFGELKQCFEAIDEATASASAARDALGSAVIPTLVELLRDAAAQASAQSAHDDAIGHLRNAARLNTERHGGPDVATSELVQSELRAAYVGAARAALDTQDWRRAESMLSQAGSIEPLDASLSSLLDRARTNAARAR